MSDKSLLWLWTHCRAIGMTKKADASEIDSLAMDIALFTADQKGEIERLIDLVAEQRRTIGALNLAIGGKDSTTTENLTHIERLRDELETFRLGKHHQENERLSLQLRDSLAAEEHCQKMRDKAERELAEARGLAAEALDALNSTEETCIRFSDLRGRLHEFYSTSDQPTAGAE